MTIHYTRFLLIGALTMASSTFALGQMAAVTSVSAANYSPIVAPDSIVAAWGANFAIGTTSANVANSGTNVTLPARLGNVGLSLDDSADETLTPALYMVSPGQINYVLPAATALGAAKVRVQSGTGPAEGPVLVSNIAPGIFTFDASGTGVPAAQVLRVTPAGVVSNESPAQTGTPNYVPSRIRLGSDQVYLVLYGTGFRRHSLNPVIAMIGTTKVPVLYAGPQNQYPGLDQINIGPLPASLAGRGTTDLVVVVDGVPANSVRVAIN